MTRFNKVLAAAALIFATPTMASALGITILNVSSTGASPTYLQHGDQITFDLRLDNPTNLPVAGLEVVAGGFDTPGTTAAISSGLSLVAGGSVAANAFATSYDANPANTDGLPNLRTAPANIWSFNPANLQPVQTILFAGIDTAGHTGNGQFDNGPGGQTGANGAHFRVTYRLSTLGLPSPEQFLTFSFGVDEQYGHVAGDRFGNTLPFTNATYALTIVPEPGTALLMGFGLVALAARRR